MQSTNHLVAQSKLSARHWHDQLTSPVWGCATTYNALCGRMPTEPLRGRSRIGPGSARWPVSSRRNRPLRKLPGGPAKRTAPHEPAVTASAEPPFGRPGRRCGRGARSDQGVRRSDDEMTSATSNPLSSTDARGPLNKEERATGLGRTECVPSFAPMRLACVVCRHVLSCSLCCEPDGMPLMIMRQMRLLCSRDNIFRLLKLGGLTMVPCGVLMMLSRQLMKFA